MNTIKRNMPNIQTGNIKNYSTYFNQMKFKGIAVDENIYDIDQQTSHDAKNVYVDDNLQLVSRPTLQPDEVPYDAIPKGDYKLVNIYDYSSAKVYVSQNNTTNKYTIVCIPKEYNYKTNRVYYALQNITKYNLCSIEQYIICFNDVNAKIIDTNKLYTTNYNWEALTDYAEVPIVKVVSGESVSEYSINELIPNKYKEQYIWTERNNPNLPINGNCDISLISEQGEYKFKDKKIYNEFAEYQLNTPININYDTVSHEIRYGGFSAAKSKVCIFKDSYFLYSANYGQNFEKILCPIHGKLIGHPQISDDGDYYFFVTYEGVYRYSFINSTWAPLFVNKDGKDMLFNFTEWSASPSMSCHFLTGDIFTFIIQNTSFFKVSNDSTLTAESNIGPGSIIASGSTLNGKTISSDTRLTNVTLISQNSTIKAGSYLHSGYYAASGSVINGKTYNGENYYGHMYTLFFKGYGLYDGNDYIDDHMDPEKANFYTLCSLDYVNLPSVTNLSAIGKGRIYTPIISIKKNRDGNNVCCIILTGADVTNLGNDFETSDNYLIYYIGGNNNGVYSGSTRMFSGYYKITSGTYVDEHGNSTRVNKPRGCEFYEISDITYPDSTSINLIVCDIFYNQSSGHDLAFPKDAQITFTFTKNNNSVTTTKTYNKYITIYNLYSKSYSGTLPRKMSNYYFSTFDRRKEGQNTIFVEGMKITDGKSNKGYIPAYSIIDFSSDEILGYGEDVYYCYKPSGDYKGIWTNHIFSTDTFTLDYTIGSISDFTKVPNVSYSNNELYLGFDNLLQITNNKKDENDATKILFNLPNINNKRFIENITGMINISTTEVALFFENKIRICTKVQDNNFLIQNKGFRYDYYNTKLSTGIRLGDSVINTLEGSYTIFPTVRGLAALNYQAFMATTDQVIEYITDKIKEIWTDFYKASENSGKQIKIIQWCNRLVLTNNTKTILLYDLEEGAWWKWEVFDDVLIALTDQIHLKVIKDNLLIFKDSNKYYDMSEAGLRYPIEWNIVSQPLHFGAPNHYKNLKQLIFQFGDHFKENKLKTMNAQIKLYRKKVTIREPEIVSFKIEELRTFVKRFNYWKINEVQWALSNDIYSADPKPLELNAIDIKYEIGEEVR